MLSSLISSSLVIAQINIYSTVLVYSTSTYALYVAVEFNQVSCDITYVFVCSSFIQAYVIKESTISVHITVINQADVREEGKYMCVYFCFKCCESFEVSSCER